MLARRPIEIAPTASNEASAALNDNGGYPSLLSDEEFEDLQRRRNQGERPEHDRLDNAGIRSAPVSTDGRPESTIEQRFAHVADQLVAMWPSEACALYLKRLIITDRRSRQGFPQDVIEDLMMLDQINEMQCRENGLDCQKTEDHPSTLRHIDESKAGFNWESVNISRYKKACT
jgi:hypothetical protein